MRLKYLSCLFIIVLYMFSSALMCGATLVVVGYYIPGVPFVRQKDPYWCGPACLAMILQYWGINVSQDEIASEIYDPVTHLTYISDMEKYPLKFNFTVESLFSNIDELKEFIREGYPIIVLQKYSLTTTYGHFRVVIDYNDKTEIIMTNDPLKQANYTISYRVFKELWEPGSTFSTTNWTLLIYKSDEKPPQNPIPIYSEKPAKNVWLTTILATVTVALVLIITLYTIKFKKRINMR